jgi:VanZ family protein
LLKKNIYTVTVSLIILYLSLATPKSIVRTGIFDIPHFDKLAHFGLYFLLMGTMIIEHRKSLTDTRKLLMMSLIPLFFGITIEFIQSLFTRNRTGEILDGIADAAGVAAAVLLWIFFRPYYYLKEKIK